jgi:hypothetical protein
MSTNEQAGRRRITHIRVRRRRRAVPLTGWIAFALLALVAWIIIVGLNGMPA